jgi:glycerol-3-phosphate dehydrogenase
VAGGKYTTFRAMAERITDLIGRRLGKRGRSVTRALRLDSAPQQPWPDFLAATSAELAGRFALATASARRLVERYGTRVNRVADYVTAPGGGEPLVPGEPELRGELAYQRDHEMAMSPGDHFLRRMRIGLYCPQVLASVDIGERRGVSPTCTHRQATSG